MDPEAPKIRSYRDKDLEAFARGLSAAPKWLPADIRRAVKRKLTMLNSVATPLDLHLVGGNRCHKLKGNLEDHQSINVNDQYRIVFRWQDDGAYDVHVIDYH